MDNQAQWISYAGKTDVGKKRDSNEDRYLIEPWGDSAVLAVVADGMGGHSGGEEAAQIAIDTFQELLQTPLPKDSSQQYQLLVQQLQEADTRIRQKACQSFYLMGMGTTIVLALFLKEGKYIYLNAGDCRFYHCHSNGEIHLLSKDHSVVRVLIDLGKISPKDVPTHPMRSVVNSCLGGREGNGQFAISPQWDENPIHPYQEGDTFLLCSDGLHGEVMDEEISKLVKKYSHDPSILSTELIEAALSSGGRDNITVAIARIGS